MESSFKWSLALPFVTILGLLFFSVPGGAGGANPQGMGYPTATFFVA
jgi:hypothetical protein